MQLHLHDKTQPENLEFLQRFRALLDEYPDRASVGEIGAEDRSLEVVAAYTGGGDKLHMSYTFDLLGSTGDPRQIARSIDAFESVVTDGWVCWALSNHDVNRHVSRWMQPGDDRERVAKLASVLLMTLRGSICLYQGEELGLEQAEVPYERLNDPQGKRFWPADKGRDGCRTPMPWEADDALAGFSTAEPWLPLDPRHRAQAVSTQGDPGSVLDHYRKMLTLRTAHPALRDGTMRILAASDSILAFERRTETEALLVVLNTGRAATDWTLPDGMQAERLSLPGFDDTALTGATLSLPAQSAALCRTN